VAAQSTEAFSPFSHGLETRRWRKALTKPSMQCLTARNERFEACVVDELQCAAGPWREADAENAAYIGIGNTLKHALVQTPHGFECLDVQKAILQRLQINRAGQGIIGPAIHD